jgi:glutathione S-transferase
VRITRVTTSRLKKSLLDLALVSTLIYPDLRQPERDWRGPHPNLAACFARISERTSVRNVLTG